MSVGNKHPHYHKDVRHLETIDVYRENGYNGREDYLSCIAEDYGLDLEQVVKPLADLLGPNEDFDGLITMLEDEASK